MTDISGADIVDCVSTDDLDVGRNLRTARERMDMNQTELAEAMAAQGFPWHQATVSQVEAGRPLRFSEAVKLAEVLQVPLVEWLALDPELFGGNVERARATAELRHLEQREAQLRADLDRTRERMAEIAEILTAQDQEQFERHGG